MRTVLLTICALSAPALYAASVEVASVPIHEAECTRVYAAVEQPVTVEPSSSASDPLAESATLQRSERKTEINARRRARAKRFFRGALTVVAIAGVAYLLHEELLDGGWIDFIPSPAPTPATRGDLLVYGGEDHEVFLGCLSCPEEDELSIWNEYGAFGSRYSSTSVLNPASEFGSRVSARSACNALALDPPLVVDRRGHVYGRLTLNPAQSPYEDAEVIEWLRGVCN